MCAAEHRTGPGDMLGTHMPEAAGNGAVLELHSTIKANFIMWGGKKYLGYMIYMKGRLLCKP